MRLGALLDGLDHEVLAGSLDVDVTAAVLDSRRVGAGDLFCCVPGGVTDGHRFAGAAVAAGAVALLVERDPALDDEVGPGPSVVRVPSVRQAMGPVAARLAGEPSRRLAVVGITGTNGKTTTAELVRTVLTAAGRRTEVIGTLTGERTTPEAVDLQPALAAAADRGAEVVALEVSSHALDQHRVDGTRFAVAVFTNLSRDHLDYHGSMEAYFRAKARLFTPDLTDRAVVDVDDPHGRLLLDAAEVPTSGCSLEEAEGLRLDADGARFTWRGHPVALALPGRFNVANALCAAHVALALGVDEATVAAGLSRPVAVAGRMERVDGGQPFTVLVDFAHTPDGLEQVLVAADELGDGGRVHVVFGCGGDRDVTKRPAMGAVAAAGADRVVLTADNSRHEDTGAILDQIRAGVDHAEHRRATEVVVEPDRRRAIALALAGAGPGDVVVVAGKGHETTQTIGEATVAFDDRQVVLDELGRRGAER